MLNIKQSTANRFNAISDDRDVLSFDISSFSQKIQTFDAKIQDLASSVSSNLTLEVGQTNLQVILTNQSLIAGEDLKINQSNARIDSLQIDKKTAVFRLLQLRYL